MEYGTAYGFFDSGMSKREISEILPDVFHMTGSKLEFILTDNEALAGIQARIDPDLSALALQAKEVGLKYVLQATKAGLDNKAAANELSVVMNQMYQSPINNDGSNPDWKIVYKVDDKYAFRE